MIADLVRSAGEAGSAGPRHPTCHYHPEARARTLCSRCGRDLCESCSPVHDARHLCPECRRPLPLAAAWARRRLFNPTGIVITTVCVFSLGYALLSGGGAGPDAAPAAGDELDREALERRSRLYLRKAAHLKVSADRLAKKGHADLAARNYRRALPALKNVLATEERLLPGRSFEAARSGRIHGVLRDTLARVAVALAECHRALDDPREAASALETALAFEPQAETASLAHYLLGTVNEEDLGDLRTAASMFRNARGAGPDGWGLSEDMLALLESPPRVKGFALVARQLTGGFEPVEAQMRLIAVLGQLGDEEEVERELVYLMEYFPFSPEAAEERKKREPVRPVSPEPADEGKPEKEREEETFRIIPLEE
jgi:tetratricopeptide (TPR) repeat protein